MHGHTSADWLEKNCIHQFCENNGCNIEDLQGGIDDSNDGETDRVREREKGGERERARERERREPMLLAVHDIYIYIYICVCVCVCVCVSLLIDKLLHHVR